MWCRLQVLSNNGIVLDYSTDKRTVLDAWQTHAREGSEMNEVFLVSGGNICVGHFSHCANTVTLKWPSSGYWGEPDEEAEGQKGRKRKGSASQTPFYSPKFSTNNRHPSVSTKSVSQVSVQTKHRRAGALRRVGAGSALHCGKGFHCWQPSARFQALQPN